jgi:linearmycin/streptolysin S transport system ATP-binding protein
MKAVLRDNGGGPPADAEDRGLLSLAERHSEVSPRNALQVSDLSKRYGATEAVAGLSFDVREGEVFGLLGPNGAGKTTTIAMLATERRPSDGDALVFGHSIRREARAVRRMIGVAPQQIALYPMLTAAENLRFFARIYGIRRAGLGDRIDHLLGLVGLQDHRDGYVGTFSGGMQRRLNLAVALVHEPRLLLLDEPTAGVDAHSRRRIFEIIGRLRDAGNAILYTTHYMEEAEGLCDRLGIMDQGKMVAMGTLSALMAQANCAEAIEVRGLGPATDLGAIRSIPGLLRLENSDGVLRLHVSNAASFLEPLRQIVIRSRQPLRLKIAPPSLEQVFLQLTGKELHD